ncbi:MAG: hypothetical protein AB2693_32095, partial [Candidatus Thiodiazotropha sp.]
LCIAVQQNFDPKTAICLQNGPLVYYAYTKAVTKQIKTCLSTGQLAYNTLQVTIKTLCTFALVS